MSIDDLRLLAARAERVDGRPDDRLDEVHGRIRAARRRRAAGAAGAAAVVAVALAVGGSLLTSTTDRSDKLPPIETPTPTETVEIPEGQLTVTAQIEPGDIRGWELRGSRTNADAGFDGATDLSLTVETGGLYAGQSAFTAFCNGDDATWWVLTFDLDGVTGTFDPSKGAEDGSRGVYGRCGPHEPTSVPAPSDVIDLNRYTDKPMAYPFRMFVVDAVPEAARGCITGGEDAIGCVARHGLSPLDSTGATFGFGVFEHKKAPAVLEVLDGVTFEALAVADGDEYLVDRAVVAAPGAARLVVTLPASDRPRILGLHQRETPAMERCGDAIDNSESFTAYQEELQRRCVNDLELRVDGTKPPRQDNHWYLGVQQTLIPPGPEHVVTVDVTRNDPRNIRYALVIWEARS